MSLYVYPSFDFGLQPMTVAVDDSSGAWPVTISTGVYSHIDYSATVPGVTLFATALKDAIEALSALTYTITYSETTRFYTLDASAGSTIKLTFAADAAGDMAKHVMGFPGTTTALDPNVSTVAVYYAIIGAMGAQQDVAEYEAPDLASVGEADDGSTYATARTTGPMLYDCTIPFEPKAVVRTRHAVAAAPWTWQMFFPHVRDGNQHFALKDSGTTRTTVHRMREDGMSFVPGLVNGDASYQEYLNIPLKTYLIGG